MSIEQWIALGLALLSFGLLVTQLAGRWPNPARYGPLEAVTAAGLVVGGSAVYLACRWAPVELAPVGMLVSGLVTGVYLGARWQESHAITRWRWPWRRQRASGA